MNRHLLKKLLFTSFVTFALILVTINISKVVFAQASNVAPDGTGSPAPEGSPSPQASPATNNAVDCYSIGGQCVTSAMNGGACNLTDGNPGILTQISGTCTNASSVCVKCAPNPNSGGSVSTSTTNTGIFSDPNTYCANNQCGVGPTIQGNVFIDTNGDGSQNLKTQYCYDQNKNKTCDEGETLYDNAFACYFAHFSGNCIKIISGNQGFAGAVVTIGSIKTTTKSDGTFKVTLPLITPAPTGMQTQTVTLTLPTGYTLSDTTNNTLSQTITQTRGQYPTVNFAIQKSEGQTTAPTCDPNGDGVTDSKDLTIIENQWYGIDAGNSGDCNKDGVVNGLDFQLWKDISVVKLNNTTLY